MEKELVSIVIITYNNEKYIEDCIKSVINQTYKNLEIIIVNDGSKDNTSDIINRYIKIDSRIKYIDRKENKGTMYTRKEGYNNSNGKYIFFLDSDDWIENNAIEKMYSNLKKNKVDIVKCNFKKYINNKFLSINNQTKENIVLEKKNFEPILYDYIYKTIYCNSMCGQLVKKELLIDINKVEDKAIYGEDIQNNLYLFEKIKSIEFLNEELYIYRCNNTSITNKVNQRKIDDLLKTFRKLYDFIEKSEIQDKQKYKIILSEKLYSYIALISIQLVNDNNKKTIDLISNMVKDSKKILQNYKNTNYLNNNILYKKIINLLSKQKYNKMYMYILLIYTPMKKIIVG